jgi:hypothetical protein
MGSRPGPCPLPVFFVIDFANPGKALVLVVPLSAALSRFANRDRYLALRFLGPPLSSTHGAVRAAAFATLRHTESAAW